MNGEDAKDAREAMLKNFAARGKCALMDMQANCVVLSTLADDMEREIPGSAGANQFRAAADALALSIGILVPTSALYGVSSASVFAQIATGIMARLSVVRALLNNSAPWRESATSAALDLLRLRATIDTAPKPTKPGAN